jgi:SAM-dependent methyltransferase
MSTSPAPSIEQLKNTMRNTWMAGDFGVVARTIASGGEDFANSLNIPPGARVLDVACGTGNTAIPLARRGFMVTGVDIAVNLLEQARERAAAQRLTVQFDEGDAEQLPYPDACFDAVVTMFGSMFAPRPELVASESARVLKSGGLLAMANWNATGFTGKIFKVGTVHVPPPSGLIPPVLWGDESTVRQRLGPYFTDIQTRIAPIDFALPTNAAGAVDFFRRYFGPTHVAFSKLDEKGQAAFAADLESIWAQHNVAPDRDTEVLVHNEYLKVTAVRK